MVLAILASLLEIVDNFSPCCAVVLTVAAYSCEKWLVWMAVVWFFLHVAVECYAFGSLCVEDLPFLASRLECVWRWKFNYISCGGEEKSIGHVCLPQELYIKIMGTKSVTYAGNCSKSQLHKATALALVVFFEPCMYVSVLTLIHTAAIDVVVQHVLVQLWNHWHVVVARQRRSIALIGLGSSYDGPCGFVCLFYLHPIFSISVHYSRAPSQWHLRSGEA